jgi:hypothetical protein
MTRFKHVSRPGWFIIGVIVAVLLVPSVAVAAGLKFTGIEGTSTNKADVTDASQLLTTEAKPSSYMTLDNTVDAADGSGTSVASEPFIDCEEIGNAPFSGEAFDADQVTMVATGVDGTISYNYQPPGASVTLGNGETIAGLVVVVAVPPGDGPGCTFPNTTGEILLGAATFTPTTDTDVNDPLTPGVAVPAGDSIWAIGELVDASIIIHGYTIPTADAGPVQQSGPSINLGKEFGNLIKS